MVKTPTPWTQDKRDKIRAQIDSEARRVAQNIGASSAVIIAFYSDGEFYHTQDGGQAPMPFAQAYYMMLSAHQAVGGKLGKQN